MRVCTPLVPQATEHELHVFHWVTLQCFMAWQCFRGDVVGFRVVRFRVGGFVVLWLILRLCESTLWVVSRTWTNRTSSKYDFFIFNAVKPAPTLYFCIRMCRCSVYLTIGLERHARAQLVHVARLLVVNTVCRAPSKDWRDIYKRQQSFSKYLLRIQTAWHTAGLTNHI